MLEDSIISAAPKTGNSSNVFSSVISGTPTMNTEKLNGPNYTSSTALVELWLMVQGLEEHLTRKADNTPVGNWKIKFSSCI